jgi:hypothetical protein
MNKFAPSWRPNVLVEATGNGVVPYLYNIFEAAFCDRTNDVLVGENACDVSCRRDRLYSYCGSHLAVLARATQHMLTI